MVTRDAPPRSSIGFGVPMSSLPRPTEEQGASPDSSATARVFEERPIAKFFAVTAMTMVGAGVAGSLVRKGGVKALSKMVDKSDQSEMYSRFLKTHRDVQRVLDDYSGAVRMQVNPNANLLDAEKLDPTNYYADYRKTYLSTEAERASARRLGAADPGSFDMRDAYQQKLVQLARRMPYELPAAYVTTKTANKVIFGEETDKRKMGMNPIDWVGDFASESLKTVAFGFLPFEGATTGIGHSWRKSLMRQATSSNSTGIPQGGAGLAVNINESLGLVGQHFSDMTAKLVSGSRRSSGAIGAAITDVSEKSRGAVEFADMARRSSGALKGSTRDGSEIPGAPLQVRHLAKSINKHKGYIDEDSGLDLSLFSIFRTASKSNTLDEAKKVVNAGLRGRASIARANTPVVGAGGTSLIERYAGSLNRLTNRSSRGNIIGGEYHDEVLRSKYTNNVIKQLQEENVPLDVAQKFARRASFTPGQGQSPFSRRVRFGNDEGLGAQEVADRANRAFGTDAFSKDVLERAVGSADRYLTSNRGALAESIDRSYKSFFKDEIMPSIGTALGRRKANYSDFSSQGINTSAHNYLLRQTARRAGVSGVDKKSLDEVTEILGSDRLKFDPNNIDQLRSYLVRKGDISKPWKADGYGSLGFKAVTVSEARQGGYFDKSARKSEIDQIGKALDSAGDAYQASLTKVGGLYKSKRGTLLDFNPVINAGRRALSVAANEFKIPLIQLRPLQTTNFSNYENAINKGPIRFTAAIDQPSLAGQPTGDTGVFFMQGIKSDGSRIRGVAKHRGSGRSIDVETGKVTALKGIYTPISTTGSTTTTTALRLMGDDSGLRRGEDRTFTDGLLGEVQKAASKRGSFSVDQPGSIANFTRRMLGPKPETGRYNLLGRVKGQREASNSPAAIARKITDGELNVDDIDARDAYAYLSSLNQTGIPKALGRHADKAKNGALKEMLELEVAPGRSIFDLDEDELFAAIQLKRAQAKTGSRAKKELSRGTIGSYYGDGPEDLRRLGSSKQRVGGLSKRSDSAKLDMIRLNAVEKAMSRSGSFDDYMLKVMEDVDELFSVGLISRTEQAEASISLLGMRGTYKKALNPRRSMERADEAKVILKELLEDVDNNPALRTALHRAGQRQDAGLLSAIKRTFDFAQGKRDIEFNPFSDEFQMVASFGTTFNRNPAKAMGSLLGFNSWGSKNAQSFSTATSFTSNLVTRMNRLFGMFGGKLDESQFSGPLGLMTKGMVGKRILPLFAAGSAFMAADRTVGGMVNDRDINGDRNYSPFLVGGLAEVGVRAQALGSGIMPGGSSYREKLDQLTKGEIAMRRGRYWLLGSTPFKGGKIDHYAPSWYRKVKSGHQYTDQLYGSPMEKMLFGQDFSPLRPLAPYRFEKRTAEDRPYPQSGDYFTGPYGPLTPVLNATVGKILKPRIEMNKGAMQQAEASMVSVGQYGVSPSDIESYLSSANTPAPSSTGSPAATAMAASSNNRYVQAASAPIGMSGGKHSPNLTYRSTIEAGMGNGDSSAMPEDVERYLQASGTPAYTSGSAAAQAMILSSGDPTSQIFARGGTISSGSLRHQGTELAYRMQEFSGIYGFGFGAARGVMGLGNMDYESLRPVTASPSDAYGFGRQFWDMNLGGLGDLPTPLEGQYANLEISEVVRRFVPRPRDRTFNPIANSMNYKAPWLPGGDGLIDFKTGDPFTKIMGGEMRLPGLGYEKIRGIQSDETGRYGRMDRFSILADVAPYSPELRQAEADLVANMKSSDIPRYMQVKEQVENKMRTHEFTPYTEDAGLVRRGVEKMLHYDSYFNRKFVNDVTAIEDYERTDIYGSAFPQWHTPIESFVKPALYKAGERNPVSAAGGLGLLGYMMGATTRAQSSLKLIGGITGAGISLFQHGKEMITGDRYIPNERKKEIAFEEYSDILKYVKSKRNFDIARASGDGMMAQQFKKELKSTMYGADIYGSTAEELSYALPKRKREHFMQFVQEDDPGERERILSTSGRLERRIYQAAWGMNVEERPDLVDYFEDRELPGATWEGWSPSVDTGTVALKTLQAEGLNASQLGYYPQELARANLINPSYSRMSEGTRGNVAAQLQDLLYKNGMSGNVDVLGFGSGSVSVSSGLG